MRFITRIHAALIVEATLLTLLFILLLCTAVIHSTELDELYVALIERNVYRTVHIYDADGFAVYDGGFSDDADIRKAYCQIIGDKDKSIPQSLLTRSLRDTQSYSKLYGYQPKGREIPLTTKTALQMAGYSMLRDNGYNGTLIVLDYDSGEIKAMVSTPVFDPADKSILPDGAYLHKALQTFVPGSVFKPVAAAAILENDVNASRDQFDCFGTHKNVYSCYGGTAHGRETLGDILYNSCNCGMAYLADKYLKPEKLDKFANFAGVVADGAAVDLAIKAGSIRSEDDLGWTANGQSKTLVSPLSLAVYYGALAKGGNRCPVRLRQDSVLPDSKRIMNEFTADYITTALTPLAGEAGIGCGAFCKTGTAQNGGDKNAHSWFICALTDPDAPHYVICTMLEFAGSSVLARSLTVDFINNFIL